MIALLIALVACDADCNKPNRVNGTYAVFHDVLNMSTDGAAKAASATVEGYDDVSYSALVNGWWRWDLTYEAASDSVNITAIDVRERMGDPAEVDGQSVTWTGSFVAHEDNCNSFDMKLNGTWTSSQDTIHAFKYESTVSWSGDGFAGDYTYSDTYTVGDGVESEGGITGASGDVIAVLQVEGFDTGFAQ
ncbi:MAG: hypothetical protein FJ102_20630 [Deltaproteobacteria bacterium]|nr:hypothetical protein [Deltaproteobacteria bacterium]